MMHPTEAADWRSPFRSPASDRAGAPGTAVDMRTNSPGRELHANLIHAVKPRAKTQLKGAPCPNARVEELLEQLRQAVRSTKDADPGLKFVDARMVLQQLLEEGDEGGGALARKERQKVGDKTRPRRTRRIDLTQFRSVLNNEDVKPEERRPRKDSYRLPLRGLHMGLSDEDVDGLFHRFADDSATLQYDALVQRLYAGDAHNAAQQGARLGPYSRGEPDPADPARPAWSWTGVMLKAPHFAKTSVMPPSNWDERGVQVCRRSSNVPSAALKLEYVFGYSGLANTSPNLFYVRGAAPGTFNVAYYTAAVGIVYEETRVEDDPPVSVVALTKLPDADLEELIVSLDVEPTAADQLRAQVAKAAIDPDSSPATVKELLGDALQDKLPVVEAKLEAVCSEAKGISTVQRRQRFFVRHNDDITCTALHPELEMVATGQSMAAKQRVSDGDTSGNGGQVYIWNARTVGVKGVSTEPKKLQLPDSDTAVCAMAFSADGWLLTTVSAQHDTSTHHVRVWDWERGVLHCSAVACRGDPPHVYGCVWNQFESWEADADGKLPEGISSFVTYGRKSIMMWEYMMGEEGRPPSIQAPQRSPKVGRWGGPPTDVLTACYVQRNVVLAGTAAGNIVAWVGSSPAAKHWAAYRPAKRATSDEDDGQWGLREGGCTALRMHGSETDRVLSAGGEKYGNGITIIDWKIRPADARVEPIRSAAKQLSKSEKVHCPIILEKQRVVRIAPGGLLGDPAAMIIGLDWHPTNLDVFVLGDIGNDIYECRFTDSDVVLRGETLLRHAHADPERERKLAELVVRATTDRGFASDSYDERAVPEELEQDLKLLGPKDLYARAEAVVAGMVPALERRQLMEGASGCVFGAAVHPLKQHVYATACEDGHLYLWDAKKRACIRQVRVARLGDIPGKRPVDWPLGKDWPTGKGDVLRVRACAFSPDGKKLAVSTGSDSGRSGVFSGSTGRRCWSHYDKGGVVRIYLLNAQSGEERAQDDVLISEGDGGFPDVDMNSLVLCEYKISSEGIDCLSFSPDSRYLGCGSHDNFVYIVDTEQKLVRPPRSAPKGTAVKAEHMGRAGTWDTQNNRLKVLRSAAAHSSYITHMDWSVPNGGIDENGEQCSLLQTSSGAHELLYLDVTSPQDARRKLRAESMSSLKKRAEAAGIDRSRVDKLISKADKEAASALIEAIVAARTGRLVNASQRNASWTSWTATLGFDVMGMWRSGMDGTDINSCCRSPDCSCFPSVTCTCNSILGAKPGGALLASADDSGAIHLLNYPAVVGDAPAIPFRGHASHVCTVRFTADGRRLISTGGADRSTMQWRVIRPNKNPKYMNAAPSTQANLDGLEVPLQDDELNSPAGREMNADDIAQLRVELFEAQQEAEKNRDVAQDARDELVKLEKQLVAVSAARDAAQEEARAMHSMDEGGDSEGAGGRRENVSKLHAELEDAQKEIERRRTGAEAAKVELAEAHSENAKLVLDLARTTAASEAGDAMAAKLRNAVRKGRTERATAEKEITRLRAEISRLNAEVSRHANTQQERHELRLKVAESERRESVAAYKLQMREGEMDKLRAELTALRKLAVAEKAGNEKQLQTTRAANGQVSAAEAAVALMEGEWSVGAERMASMSVVALGQLRTKLEANSRTIADAIDRVAVAEAAARVRVMELLDRVDASTALGGEEAVARD